jgi:hypothetical protein
MSKNKFIIEQVKELSKNKNIKNVTYKSISYTFDFKKSFKRI